MKPLPIQMNYALPIKNANNANAFLRVSKFRKVLGQDFFSFYQFLGCDCDANSQDPDELCPVNKKCKQCKCLLEGNQPWI